MPIRSNTRSAIIAIISVAAVVGGVFVGTTSDALAGSCPADKAGDNTLVDAAKAPAGVTDEVLSMIDLSQEKVALDGRLLRLRRLEIQPGGVVPLHSHGDRPALIYIVKGTVEEYSSRCLVPIVHKPGEAAHESIGLMHWWKNTGSEVAVLLSADLFPTTKEDPKTM